MKFQSLLIFLVIFVIQYNFIDGMKANKCKGPHEEWRDCGPTYMCDNQVCRGARPICTEEDATICVAGCFCKEGYSRDGSKCVKECPLYP